MRVKCIELSAGAARISYGAALAFVSRSETGTTNASESFAPLDFGKRLYEDFGYKVGGLKSSTAALAFYKPVGDRNNKCFRVFAPLDFGKRLYEDFGYKGPSAPTGVYTNVLTVFTI